MWAEVQQRGVAGTVAILQSCLAGVTVPEGSQVHIFDLLPNRFAEWSRAVWHLQLEFVGSRQMENLPYTYTGYMLDANEADAMGAATLGRAMKDRPVFHFCSSNTGVPVCLRLMAGVVGHIRRCRAQRPAVVQL